MLGFYMFQGDVVYVFRDHGSWLEFILPNKETFGTAKTTPSPTCLDVMQKLPYFSDNQSPTEKELATLSLIEPEIYQDVINILENIK